MTFSEVCEYIFRLLSTKYSFLKITIARKKPNKSWDIVSLSGGSFLRVYSKRNRRISKITSEIRHGLFLWSRENPRQQCGESRGLHWQRSQATWHSRSLSSLRVRVSRDLWQRLQHLSERACLSSCDQIFDGKIIWGGIDAAASNCVRNRSRPPIATASEKARALD